MKAAIVHHWFVSHGGGERVVEAMARVFPEADIFTLLTGPQFTSDTLNPAEFHRSFLSRVPFSSRFHRQLLPLYPLAVETLDLRGYDLVISSDAGPVKGVITGPDTVHLCYCHSPMRYLWNQYQDYYDQLPWLAKVPFALASHYVRCWDYAAAQRVNGFLANSENVAARIRQYYGRSSEVLYPPVDTHRGAIASDHGDHYLSVGRLVGYKRIGLLIEACNYLQLPLRIVGTGPEEARLRDLAGPTVQFLGHVNANRLWEEYAHCRALLVAADEDFGIVSVEAQACGRPVIAFGKGGSLETVLSDRRVCPDEQPTGIFFFEQSPRALMNAIREFEATEQRFIPSAIREWTRKFDARRFERRLQEIAEDSLESKLLKSQVG